MNIHRSNYKDKGFSLPEVMIGAAIFLVLVFYLVDSITQNMSARSTIDDKAKFIQTEELFRSYTFLTLAEAVEADPSRFCRNPEPFLKGVFGKSTGDMRVLRLERRISGIPPAMQKRCLNQTSRDPVDRGIYLCFEIRPSSQSPKNSFLKTNSAYAEVFYELWDPLLDKNISCLEFQERSHPVRGAKMLYTIYWQNRTEQSGNNSKFFRHAGTMYAPTTRVR